MIKNIVFDFGGVLVDWNPRYLFKDLFETEEEMEDFLANICTTEWNIQQDAGRSLAEGTRVLQAQFPEHREMIQQFYDGWKVMLKAEIPEHSNLLEPLSKKFPLYGLTNWSGETFPYARERFPFFNKFFKGIVVSGDEKMIKPDRKIFDLLLERYQLEAPESVFIDDNYDNILTAKELGFITIHITDGVDLKKELKELKLL